MFVFEKMKDGKRGIRPAYIGFIKHNYLRRTLCIGFSPITLLVVIFFNLVKLCLWLTGRVVALFLMAIVGAAGAFYMPAKGMLTNWREIWHKPREKK